MSSDGELEHVLCHASHVRPKMRLLHLRLQSRTAVHWLFGGGEGDRQTQHIGTMHCVFCTTRYRRTRRPHRHMSAFARCGACSTHASKESGADMRSSERSSSVYTKSHERLHTELGRPWWCFLGFGFAKRIGGSARGPLQRACAPRMSAFVAQSGRSLSMGSACAA